MGRRPIIDGMRGRMVVLAAVGVAGIVALRGRSHAGRATGDHAFGWSTCSAPSAGWYDAIFGGPLRALQQQLAADLAATTADLAVHDVLDIGAGPGILAVELAGLLPSARITGLDIDPAMVERATGRATREGCAGRVSFVIGDAARLPFPDGSFDLVTSTFSVHHWADAPAGFAEIHRVLRPGGRAIVYDLPDWWGRLERGARPIAASAAAGGMLDATLATFRWPGRLPLAARLTAGRAGDG